jgi:dihydrofolate reductase
MRQIILYTAASLDSYIARPDGDVEWLHSPEYTLPNEDYGYSEFYNSIDTTVMGNNTYKIMLGFDAPFPMSDKTNYVLSRSSANQDNEHVKFIYGDIVEFVRQLKNEKGKDIWLVGGGEINTLLLNNHLIDKIILTLIPVIIGEGIPLFSQKVNETRFELDKSATWQSGLVQLILKIKQ